MKSKKIILTLVIVLILLIVLGAGAFAGLYFATDMFKSEKELFWKYFSKNAQIVDMLNNENMPLQTEVKNQSSYTTTGNFNLSMQVGESDPVEFNAETNSRHDINTNRTYADIKLKNKDNNDILAVSYINSEDVYAIKCEDIYENYIGVRNGGLKEFFGKLGLTEEQLVSIPDSIDFDSLTNDFKLSEEEIKQLQETYSNAILQGIPEESYQKLGKETITNDDGTTYEANKYGLTINSQVASQVFINILTALKSDNIILSRIVTLAEQLQATTTDGEEITIESIIAGIDEMISNIDVTEEAEGTLNIFVYEQGGKTVKTIFEVPEQGTITFDLSENKATILSQMTEASTNYKITISKSAGQDITNTMEIVPDIDEAEESITISTTLGNTQNGVINNSYSIIINVNSYDSNNIMEISYNTQITPSNQVEEIMELKNSNTVIVNNYPLEQLAGFFEGISPKFEQTMKKVVEELQTEINAITTLSGTSGSGSNSVEVASLLESSSLKESIIETSNAQLLLQPITEDNSSFDEYELLKIIQSNVPQNYNIVSSDDLKYDLTSKKINGTMVVANNSGASYKIDFTNEEVTVENT